MEALPLVVAKFPEDDRLLDEDGTPMEVSLAEVLNFNQTDIPNLCSVDQSARVFRFHYSEGDVVTRLVAQFPNQPPVFTLRFLYEQRQEGGVNYLGRIEVDHGQGKVCSIMLPGERTYDPADDVREGFVNRNTFRLIICVTVAEVMAARLGVSIAFLEAIHKVTRTIVDRYYGKFMLQDWMKYQVESACYSKTEPLLYPRYISKSILEGAVKGCNQEKVTQNLQDLESHQGKSGSPPALLKVRDIQNLMANRGYKKELKTELGPEYRALKALLQQKSLVQVLGKRILAQIEPAKEEKEGTLTHLRERATALEVVYIKRFCQMLNLESLDIEKPLKGQCEVF